MPFVHFIAVLLTALSLIAPGAHLFAMSNKMTLDMDAYQIVQSIYYGWWIYGIVAALALAANLLAGWVGRSLPGAVLSVVAAGLIVLWFAIFLVWTQPMNAATANWTRLDQNWLSQRDQWEFSHAANAVVMFLALIASLAAALRRAGAG